MLRINTFGLRPAERYGLPDRRHSGADLEALEPEQLYEGFRGTIIGVMRETLGGDPREAAKLLRTAQTVVAELIRRMLPRDRVTLLQQPDLPLLPDEQSRAFSSRPHRGPNRNKAEADTHSPN